MDASVARARAATTGDAAVVAAAAQRRYSELSEPQWSSDGRPDVQDDTLFMTESGRS